MTNKIRGKRTKAGLRKNSNAETLPNMQKMQFIWWI